MPIATTRLPTTTVNGSSVLGTTFEITASNATYEAVGLSISLPSAGHYKLFYDVRASARYSSGSLAYIVAKLRDTTNATDVANSERLVVLQNVINVEAQNQGAYSVDHTATGPATIALYVFRDGASTYTASHLYSDANGRIVLSYVKLSD